MKVEDVDFNKIYEYKEYLVLPDEVWVAVKNYKDLYEVSNYGRVKSVARYDSAGRFRKSIIMNTGDNGGGYRYLVLRKDGNYKNHYVHRLVSEHFLDNPDNLPQVNHKPSGFGKHDNRASHLEWCSASHNIKDAHDNGQMVNRTVHKTQIDRKSDNFIKAMYTHYKETGKVGETARIFGVPRTTLSSIVNKRSRTDITDEIDLEFDIA